MKQLWYKGIVFGIAALATTLCLAPSAHAQDDHRNIQENLPLEIEDATPIEPGKILLQHVFRWDRVREHGERRDRYLIEPRVQLGISKSFDLIVASTFYQGDASHAGSGNVRLEGLYNFQPETRHRPAIAFSMRLDAPSGVESHGVDGLVELHVTRSLRTPREPGDDTQPQIHFNLGTNINTDPLDDETTTGYRAILGFSKPVARHTTLVADVYSEQEPKEAIREHLVGVGVRHQTGRTVFTAGSNVGVGPDSPSLTLTFGTQYAL